MSALSDILFLPHCGHKPIQIDDKALVLSPTDDVYFVPHLEGPVQVPSFEADAHNASGDDHVCGGRRLV